MKYAITHIDDPVRREQTLLRLWANSNLHESADPHHKYAWFYRDNPAGAATAFFLSEEAEGVVGCCGLGTRLLWVDGAPQQVGLLADFAVDPSHRTTMPALILQRSLCAGARERFPLTYGFPNSAAVGLFKRIGFPVLGTMPRYGKVLRHAKFVQRRIPLAAAAKVLGAVADAGARTAELVERILKPRSQRLEWLSAPDDRFDDCFERTRAQYRFIGDRTAKMLRWRFTERPGRTSEFATLVDDRDNLIGYAAVVQKEPGVALIADFLAVSDDALTDLFRRLLPELRRRGFESAKTFFLGPPAAGAVLRSRGFVLRDSAKYVVVGAGKGLSIRPEALTDVKDWYLTEADRDN
jgi:N-acetylglutamate synthase-like GNAT family acetyltransferase